MCSFRKHVQCGFGEGSGELSERGSRWVRGAKHGHNFVRKELFDVVYQEWSVIKPCQTGTGVTFLSQMWCEPKAATDRAVVAVDELAKAATLCIGESCEVLA